MLRASSDALSRPPWWWPSIVHSRRNVGAGTRTPNCGMSRSK